MIAERKLKGLLVLGFLGHLVATVVAWSTPATGYELSIYRATPPVFWVGIGLAFATAVTVALYGRRRVRDGAILLAVISGLSVVALPIIRGYHFRGAGDALTHLGYASLIGQGTMTPAELLYPGTHLVALLLAAAGDVSLPDAFQYMPLLFVGLFLAFVPLTIRAISDRGIAVVAGVFAALLFLPINLVGTHLSPHPSSQTILYLPLVLFLLLSYLSSGPNWGGLIKGVGLLLSISLIVLVILHPQEALDVLLILGAIAGTQYVVRRKWPWHPIAGHRPLYGHTLLLLVAFTAWSSQHAVVGQWIGRAFASLVTGGAAASEVTTRTTSLQAVGGSLEELFVKLFLVQLVFLIAAGLLVVASITDRLEDAPQTDAFVAYLGLGIVPLITLFAVVFAADLGDHYFRFLGAIMVVVTVLGAVAFSEGLPSLVARPRRATVRRVAVLSVVLILLPLSLMTVFPSPYIFQPSDQVTEMEMTGYATALEQRDPSIEFLAIRETAPRFVDAVYGPDQPVPGEFDAVNETAFRGDLLGADPDPRYLAVTDRDINRETEVYDGFRYESAGFRSLETTPGINKVQTNGAFQLYQLRGQDS